MTTGIDTSCRPVWRLTFLVLEAALIVSGVGLALIQRVSDPRIHMHSRMEDILGSVFVVSMFVLLLGSPWFLRSLRGVALAGWAIAFAAFVWCILTPPL